MEQTLLHTCTCTYTQLQWLRNMYMYMTCRCACTNIDFCGGSMHACTCMYMYMCGGGSVCVCVYMYMYVLVWSEQWRGRLFQALSPSPQVQRRKCCNSLCVRERKSWAVSYTYMQRWYSMCKNNVFSGVKIGCALYMYVPYITSHPHTADSTLRVIGHMQTLWKFQFIPHHNVTVVHDRFPYLAFWDTLWRHTAKLDTAWVHTDVSDARLRDIHAHTCTVTATDIHVHVCTSIVLIKSI